MDPHPVPRQVTTFEFKLIGFLTLKQFIYLALFISLALVFFYLIPIPGLNLVLAGASVFLGYALAFIPVNERPLNVLIKNFVKKLFSPSQYYYSKKNESPDFLKDVFIPSAPQLTQQHIDARQKLSSYVSKTTISSKEDQRKQQINQLLNSLEPNLVKTKPTLLTQPVSQPATDEKKTKPFLFGVVKNNKNIPLPHVLVYIKNKSDQILRILKTNSHGMFATFHPLNPDEYLFEIKDSEGRYFFDTMKMKVGSVNEKSISIRSKELL